MLLKFQRDTTAFPSGSSEVIIRADGIVDMQPVTVEDRRLGVNRSRTSVKVFNFPDVSFTTRSSVDDIASVVTVIDGTQGVGTGSQCDSVGVLSTAYPSIWWPFIKLNVWQNNSTDKSLRVVAVSSLVLAEPAIYFDRRTASDISCTRLIIREATPLTIYTDLTFVDMCALLRPLDVPTTYE